jgi:RimJ/RimL family protein N-acetyltransferase
MTPHLADTPVLETARLTLAAPAPRDWEPWAAFAATERSRYLGGPYDRPLAWRAFCHMIGMWVMRGYGFFIFREKGGAVPLGAAGLWFPEGAPEPEIGWSLWPPEAEGEGFATEAAAAVRDHVFRDVGLKTAVSYIDPANTRSIRVAERLGARPDPAATTPEGGQIAYRHPAPEALQ